MEPGGRMCASHRITARRSFTFFGHESSPESMWLTVMSTERLFLKNGQSPESFSTEQDEERGCLFLISLY